MLPKNYPNKITEHRTPNVWKFRNWRHPIKTFKLLSVQLNYKLIWKQRNKLIDSKQSSNPIFTLNVWQCNKIQYRKISNRQVTRKDKKWNCLHQIIKWTNKCPLHVCLLHVIRSSEPKSIHELFEVIARNGLNLVNDFSFAQSVKKSQVVTYFLFENSS